MYSDESPINIRSDRIMTAVEPDERIGLMQAFVQADDERDDLRRKQAALADDLARVEERRGDLLQRLGTALGMSQTAVATSGTSVFR